MANMARHGSAANATYNGFTVFQPALGATLQWLPHVGTPELDDMINAFLPGPASIKDKRAHISMDFFEYSRLTGETMKFYPVAVPATTPIASPYDSGYGSSFNTSPVISDQSSWTQSPVPFTPIEEPVVAPRTTTAAAAAAKKSSTSSTIDFASHPGMRIMTKDGRDVTNSASRGCKTKEQRDHAHLMRIIKACDACKRKKVRCDPSHRRRNGSQASASPAETRSAKKSKKTQKPAAPVKAAPPPTDSLAADAMMAPEMTFSLSAFDTTVNGDEFDDLFTQFVDFDQQQPLAVAANDFNFNDFVFDSFTDTQSFSTPSSVSVNSPSHVFAPSPTFVSELTTEVSAQAPVLPYMNPDVALGTNYIDFNLYSPASSYYDEDPVFLQTDVGSRHSPAAVTSAAGLPQELPQHVPGGSARPSPAQLSATDQYYDQYYDHNEGYLHDRTRYIATSPSSASGHAASSHSSSAGVENVDSVVASVSQSSVSPRTTTRPRVITPGVLDISPTSSPSQGVIVNGGLPRPIGTSNSAIATTSSQSQSQLTSIVGVTGVYGNQSRRDIAVNNVIQSSVGQGAISPVDGQCCSVPEQLLLQCSVLEKGLNVMLTTIRAWKLPARRVLAEKEGKEVQKLQLSPAQNLSQLVVFGLVSIFCAFCRTHSASQISFNPFSMVMMAMTLISLGSIALLQLWCVGPPRATCVASKGLQIPTPRAPAGDFQSLVGRRGRSLLHSLNSASFRVR